MRSVRLLIAASAIILTLAAGKADELTPAQQAFRQIYQELVEINTTDSVGDTVKAAEAMAAHLRAAGITDVQVISTAPRKGNLVARLPGTGTRRPLLLTAHIDVVEAKREDWDTDPFKLQEKDGVLQARGAIDDKAMAAAFVANLIQYKQEGFRPDRDIILALTTDEELSDSPHDGVHWLSQNKPDLINAELAINEGGGGAVQNGRPARLFIQLAEKVYQSYRFEVTDPGGHSAAPRRDNPIYRLAGALTRLGQFDFPVSLNPVTRAYFQQVAATENPEIASAIAALLAGRTDATSLASLLANPGYNAQLHTTCVATMLDAGHAENALPQTARATINCRILPGASVAEVEQTLNRVVDDPKVAVIPIGRAVESPPSPLSADVMQAVERVSNMMWPGVTVIPVMSGGYTDSRWLRNGGIAAYGVSGLFSDGPRSGVHGRNEHVGASELYQSKEFLYALVKELASGAGNQVSGVRKD
jgi:acetylornithine deacetylase/succinyl-diaminopimelate desuccinylase-like protein